MNKPTKNVKFELYDYNEVIRWIESKYGIKTRDYSGEETKDFWHYLLEWYFESVSDGCVKSLPVEYMVKHEDTPDWVRQISQYIYDEFNEGFNSEGEMELWVSW